MEELKPVAEEALHAFEAISHAAAQSLQARGLSFESFASVNQSTAENLARDLLKLNETRISDCQKLVYEPTIARIVVVDEFDKRETLYISPAGTVQAGGVVSCSYLSPKGRLAALSVGDGDNIRLPGGDRWFEVIEKMTFKPVHATGHWDSRPAVEWRETLGPRTIKSLRDLLASLDTDALEQWLADDTTSPNVVDGIIREALVAMEMRVAALLDKVQDEILRLPLGSRIAVLGPPGTGKTTTLIKRLRRTVDLAHLEPDEQLKVGQPDEAGLDHPDSWIMFTPTELLRQYVKEAFGKQGVPVHDQRLKTWDDYRYEIGRRDLTLLQTGTRKGFVIKPDLAILQPETLRNQIAWYEAFDAFQREAFLSEVAVEAERLATSEDARVMALASRVKGMVERGQDRPLGLIGELAGLTDDLREVASAMGGDIQQKLNAPLQTFARSDASFLDDLSAFVGRLLTESANDGEDDPDEEQDDEDEDEAEAGPSLSGRRLTIDMFRRAMRARALAQATGRSVGTRSRSGRILQFVTQRDLTLPDLKALGAELLVQRAARRIAGAPTKWLTGVARRYRQFRRHERAAQRWYTALSVNANDAHPAEIDVMLLALLSQARDMSRDTVLPRRFAEHKPALMDAITRLRRNQVLIDEATDFSPIQLAIMRNLARNRTDAVFVSGDFNQRLTIWGSRNEEQLLWAVPNADIRKIAISYRQSRKLADFAANLSRLQGEPVEDIAPVGLDNEGVTPVVGTELGSVPDLAAWLAARIREIERLTGGIMPTIAVLAEHESALEPLALALTAQLEDLNLRAVACPKGLVKGLDSDVRIFDAQHIKGLEFEAVFFTNIDKLAQQEPELVDRFIYVGATRAATFLGLTVSGKTLPGQLDALRGMMEANWESPGG